MRVWTGQTEEEITAALRIDASLATGAQRRHQAVRERSQAGPRLLRDLTAKAFGSDNSSSENKGRS